MFQKFSQYILPPFWMLIGVAMQITLHYLFPVFTFHHLALLVSGLTVMGFGVGLVLTAARRFRARGTPMKPFSPSTYLVRDGLYRYTRNPMYLGMGVLLLGSALAIGSLSALVVVPLFFLVIHYGYVVPEERFLFELFGPDFTELQEEVPRWLFK